MKAVFKIFLLILLIVIILSMLRSCDKTRPIYEESCNSLGLDSWCDLGLTESQYYSRYVLCPPVGGEATMKPMFFPMNKEGEMWVAYGNFWNQHKEVFSIRVAGKRKDAINDYTANVKVCADVVLLNKETEGSHQDDAMLDDEMLTDKADSSDRNLFIEMDFVAKGFSISDRDLDQFLRDKPIISPIRRDIVFGELRSSPSILSLKSIFKSPESDHAIDFIIDPPINKNVFHDYYSRCRRNASVIIKTGANKVSGYLYRGGKQIKSRKNITSGTALWSRKMYASNSGRHRRYDAGVFGEKNASHYEISGTWVTGSKYDETNRRRGYAYGC